MAAAGRMRLDFLLATASDAAHSRPPPPPLPPHLPKLPSFHAPALAEPLEHDVHDVHAAHSPVAIQAFNADDMLTRQISAAEKARRTSLVKPVPSSAPPPAPMRMPPPPPPPPAPVNISSPMSRAPKHCAPAHRPALPSMPSPTTVVPPTLAALPSPPVLPPTRTPSPGPYGGGNPGGGSGSGSVSGGGSLSPALGIAAGGVAKKYVCDVAGCGSVFGQKGSLTRHQKSRHEGRRPHVCGACGKRFSEKWTLNVHERNVHEKRKPHACPECNKRFGERWNLRKHINVVHRNIKPYACPQCGRAFGYKGDMRKHVMELHVQDGRPYQCAVPSCGVKFARLRYLRRHQNLSHPPTSAAAAAICTPVSGALPTAEPRSERLSGVVGEVRAARAGAATHARRSGYSALETLSLYAVEAARCREPVKL